MPGGGSPSLAAPNWPVPSWPVPSWPAANRLVRARAGLALAARRIRQPPALPPWLPLSRQP
ncbi:MAG: hypothetical protein J2P35_18315, partial [Actinobacteria bacterium]|nr:hypothetical protein [Actinomycetota bacterium]